MRGRVPQPKRGLHGPYLKVFPLVANKYPYQAQQSWISFLREIHCGENP